MFERLNIQGLLNHHQVTVVHAQLAGTEVTFDVLPLRRKGTSLERQEGQFGITSLESAMALLKNKPAVVLVVSGKGVLTRKVSAGLKGRKLLDAVLPNARLEEFYVQSLPIKNGVLVSVLRQHTIDQLFEALNNAALVVDLHLGPLCLLNYQILLSKRDNFHVAGYRIEVDGDEVSGLTSAPAESAAMTIGSEVVPTEALLPFAAGLQHFFQLQPIQLQEVDFSTTIESVRHRQLFRKAGGVVLALLFTLLLANYLMFDHYKNYYAELESSINLNKEQVLRVESLQQQLAKKEELLASTGLLNQQSLAVTADRIAGSIPEEIQLTRWEGRPLRGKLNTRNQPEFEQQSIEIAGTVSSSQVLNSWIKELTQLPPVKGVEIIEFDQVNLKEPGEFELRLNL